MQKEAASWRQLKGKNVVGLFSGGLDSQTIVNWLKSLGIKVTSITLNSLSIITIW